MTTEQGAGPIIVGPERIGELTTRERFRRVMHYQAIDRIPHMEFGFWDSLKERWMAEGHLPVDLRRSGNGVIRDDEVERFFGCEQRTGVGPAIDAGPHRPIEVVEEREGKVVYRDGLGILCEEVQEGIRSIPHFLEFPIVDRSSWEAFRDEFLDLDADWRVKPEEWNEARARELQHSELPVGTSFGSFIGRVRDWMGFQSLAFLSYDDPQLLEEMVAHVTALKLKYLPPLLDKIEFDFASGWEDICFNSGPLLSPAVFRQIIIPHMKPVMKMLRQHGIDIIFTDCDGNIQALIPLWLDVGLNCMFPYEINAGNDVVQARVEYGRDLLILGGFDKFALLDSKEAILAQFRRLEPVLADGGFIPHIDHRCPDGVAFEMYQYYVREKLHFLGWPKDEIERIPGLQGT
ncbi:MAG TPA: uroporphyrinogen decarboxylase family protein [Anaerolineae bacterium]|nr:uroporphyrinogen decarboxylase family protein [Anaerolineae bacterium]